jgi:hypothetical protein
MAADPELLRAQMLLQQQMIDPLWQTAHLTGGYGRLDEEGARVVCLAARQRVYGFLAARLGLPREQAQADLFDLDQCRAAWRALQGVDYPAIKDWATKRPPRKTRTA